MSARDVIAAEFGRMHQSVCYPTASDGEKEWAGDSILSALTAAGWTLAPPGSRVVPEGGVDAETVERAAKAISRMIPLYGESWLEPHGHNFPKQYSAREQRLIRGIATAALRALAEAKP